MTKKAILTLALIVGFVACYAARGISGLVQTVETNSTLQAGF